MILFDKVETIFGREISAEQKKRCRIIKDNFQLSTNFEQLTAGIDTVYHLISTTLPNNSNQNIGMGLMDNVIVTASFLDACVKNGVKRVLFLSSGGTVYGVSAKMPLEETACNEPISGYGLQKITIEKLLYLYWYLYGLDYRIVRLSNPYGKYQKPNGIQGVMTTFVFRVIFAQLDCITPAEKV